MVRNAWIIAETSGPASSFFFKFAKGFILLHKSKQLAWLMTPSTWNAASFEQIKWSIKAKKQLFEMDTSIFSELSFNNQNTLHFGVYTSLETKWLILNLLQYRKWCLADIQLRWTTWTIKRERLSDHIVSAVGWWFFSSFLIDNGQS